MRNTLLAFVSALALLALLFWSSRGLAPASRGAPEPAASPPAQLDVPASAAQLTARARADLENDPAAALQDIAQADRLAGPQDEARRALEIVALVRLGRVGHARALAEAFYQAFPGSAQSAELERLTGAHPRPQGP